MPRPSNGRLVLAAGAVVFGAGAALNVQLDDAVLDAVWKVVLAVGGVVAGAIALKVGGKAPPSAPAGGAA